MKIEIWSDVMCPFCYIGKRKFESALAQFDNKDNIEIIWKSFQLAPDMLTQPDKNIHQFLAEHKGMSLDKAKEMNDYVTNLAKQVGLAYDFDKAIPANSFKAHQFLHLAKQFGLQEQAEEAMFQAYLTEGKNIDDIDTLVKMGERLGLNQQEARKAMENNQYATVVNEDINEARQLGVNGVPFFVFDRKVAISGAQESSIFLDTIEKTFTEWRKHNDAVKLEIIDGKSCEIGEDCN